MLQRGEFVDVEVSEIWIIKDSMFILCEGIIFGMVYEMYPFTLVIQPYGLSYNPWVIQAKGEIFVGLDLRQLGQNRK